MEALETLVREILDKGFLMSLATVDDGGPWVSDVIYVAKDFDLYWLSQESSRHSKAIEKIPQVAATITLANTLGEEEIGLQIAGKARKVEGNFSLAIAHRKKRGKEIPTSEEGFLDKGESWYMVHPSKIEIINAPKWGFKKRSLTFF